MTIKCPLFACPARAADERIRRPLSVGQVIHLAPKSSPPNGVTYLRRRRLVPDPGRRLAGDVSIV